jgi:hypothetical protein
MKEKIHSKDKDGKEKVLFIEKPTKRHDDVAKVVSNRVFSRGIRDKDSLLRKELNNFLRDRGLWDDEKETELKKLITSVNEKVEKLNAGGIELEEAKKLALEIKTLRIEQLILLAETREFDQQTLEAKSENAYFDALVSSCTFNEDGTKTFSSYEDYLENSTEQYAVDAASKLSELLYGSRKDWEKDLPENKFLVEFNFVNEDLELVNEDGHLVDSQGKLINKDGRYVDKEGNFIDRDGNRVDESGNKIVERKPFLKNGKKIK